MTPKEICKAVVAAYAIGDCEGITSRAHPDAIFRFPGDPAYLPWAGEFPARDLKKFFDAIKDTLDFFIFACESIRAEGDYVFFKVHEYCRVRSTGRFYTNKVAGWMEFSGRKISAYYEYSDTAAMEAALQAQPSRPGEFHPEPLTEPDLNLSIHPARAPHRRLPSSAETRGLIRFPVGS